MTPSLHLIVLGLELGATWSKKTTLGPSDGATWEGRLTHYRLEVPYIRFRGHFGDSHFLFCVLLYLGFYFTMFFFS
jgi:hypothetical protein